MRMHVPAAPGETATLERRTFLKGVAGAAWALSAGTFVACGDDEAPGTGGEARPSIDQEQGELQVFEWSGYEKPDFWKEYATAHGKDHKPNFTFYATDDEALTKVRSGFKPDVAHPCSGRLPDWVEAGLVEEIDTSLLERFGDLEPTLVAEGKIDGKQYWIPWDWGYSSLIVNTDVVDNPGDSWRLLWDVRYKGKISMWDNPTTALRIGGLYVGVEDVYDMTDEELEAVKAALIEQKKLNRNYWAAEADMVPDFASGNIAITNGWTSAYLSLVAEDVPVSFGKPSEGRLAFNCGFVIIKGTPRYHLAHAWIDAFSARDASAALGNNYGYGFANTKALPLVDKERRKIFELSSPDALEPPNTWLDAYFPRRDKYIQVWDEVKAS